MCGIAGIVHPEAGPPVDEVALRRMARSIRHRGPDGWGYVLDHGAGLVSSRLAIVDLPGGWQPLEAERGGAVLVYNGEVYNHPELRAELEARGEVFETTCDTEVVLRLLELEGLPAFERLNGQFAFGWWTPDKRRLTMVRDRFGVRPLYYALAPDGTLVFGSEAKALFASGVVQARRDLAGIDEVFTLWGARAPETVFEGVHQVPAGGVVTWERGEIVAERRWWTPTPGGDGRAEREGELEELLRDSVRLRLRADVPVGTYLSGGLDSSLITALARSEVGDELRTFSVAFRDPRYDERSHQAEVAQAIGTRHHVVEVGSAEIAAAFPDVVRQVETPLIRTAPVPMFLLAHEVRANGITVVASGEGADELFWGYDLFKEVVLRELNAHDPQRAATLVDELYEYLGPSAGRRGPLWRQFLLETGAADELLGSHLTRAEATATVKALYRPEVAEALGPDTALERLRAELPRELRDWSALERAAWLEVSTLLEPYLLSAQGDRVAMAHGVEGRFPFLDHRVFDLATALPAERKLDGLRDKVALRELAAKLLPEGIAARRKQPYRAPEVEPFFADPVPEYVEEALSEPALEASGIWDPQRVAGLVKRCRAGRATGVREGMALVAVLSTQLLDRAFLGVPPASYSAESAEPRVRIDRVAGSRGSEVA
jgi:asparagine synthase (glutamine-hydrolysing)